MPSDGKKKGVALEDITDYLSREPYRSILHALGQSARYTEKCKEWEGELATKEIRYFLVQGYEPRGKHALTGGRGNTIKSLKSTFRRSPELGVLVDQDLPMSYAAFNHYLHQLKKNGAITKGRLGWNLSYRIAFDSFRTFQKNFIDSCKSDSIIPLHGATIYFSTLTSDDFCEDDIARLADVELSINDVQKKIDGLVMKISQRKISEMWKTWPADIFIDPLVKLFFWICLIQDMEESNRLMSKEEKKQFGSLMGKAFGRYLTFTGYIGHYEKCINGDTEYELSFIDLKKRLKEALFCPNDYMLVSETWHPVVVHPGSILRDKKRAEFLVLPFYFLKDKKVVGEDFHHLQGAARYIHLHPVKEKIREYHKKKESGDLDIKKIKSGNFMNIFSGRDFFYGFDEQIAFLGYTDTDELYKYLDYFASVFPPPDLSSCYRSHRVDFFSPSPRENASVYPGFKPMYSYFQKNGYIYEIKVGEKIEDSTIEYNGEKELLVAKLEELGLPSLDKRYPVLGYGSNSCPGQLNMKGIDYVIALRGKMLDMEAVYAHQMTGYGSVPYTLVRKKGDKRDSFVTLLDKEQLQRMDSSEGRGSVYNFVKLDEGQFFLENDYLVDPLYAYIISDKKGLLLRGNSPVSVTKVKQETMMKKGKNGFKTFDIGKSSDWLSYSEIIGSPAVTLSLKK